ncbi:MAG: sterol desaturase family protein [Bdellovibrionota bacterium]
MAKRKGIQVYSWADTSTNFTCALGQGLLDLPVLFVIGAVFAFLHDLTPLNVPFTLASSVALFVLTDFLSYWFHRASHRLPFLWRVHAVHHQSEEFNFSVGFRIPWFHKLVAFPIYLPPALLGFSFSQYLVVAFVHAMLQTFSHTRVYDADWPIFRDLFVTPVHHRVHHSRLPQHLDKNFSNIFSIWDRLFGTGLRDTTEPVYGIGEGRASYNPLRAQLEPFELRVGVNVISMKRKIISLVLLAAALVIFSLVSANKAEMTTVTLALSAMVSLALAIASGSLLEPSRVPQRSVENHPLQR